MNNRMMKTNTELELASNSNRHITKPITRGKIQYPKTHTVCRNDTAPPSNLEFKVTTAEPNQKITKTWANSGPPCPELCEFELLCKSL